MLPPVPIRAWAGLGGVGAGEGLQGRLGHGLDWLLFDWEHCRNRSCDFPVILVPFLCFWFPFVPILRDDPTTTPPR
jgi:hypothetical protein